MFVNILQSALQKSCKASIKAMSAFNAVTFHDGTVKFTAEDSAEGKKQFKVFLEHHLFPHALLRRLYHVKEGTE